MRGFGLAMAAALFSTSGSTAGAHDYRNVTVATFENDVQQQRASIDVPALLASARGAPPMICAMAA